MLSLDTLKSVNNVGHRLEKLEVKSPSELKRNWNYDDDGYYISRTHEYSLFLRLILANMYKYCIKLLKHPMFDFDLIRYERYAVYYGRFGFVERFDMTPLHVVFKFAQMEEINFTKEVTTRLTMLKEIISILAENDVVEACIDVICHFETPLNILIRNLCLCPSDHDNYHFNFDITMEIMDLLITKMNPKNVENITQTIIYIIEKRTQSDILAPTLLKKVLNHVENGAELLLNTIHQHGAYCTERNRNLFFIACEKGNTPCASFIYDYLLTNTGITSNCKANDTNYDETNDNNVNAKYYKRLKHFFNATVENYCVYEYNKVDMTPYIRACYKCNDMALVRYLVLHCKDFVDITQRLTNVHNYRDVDLIGTSAFYQRGSDLFGKCAKAKEQKEFYHWLVKKENERADMLKP